MSRMQSKIQHTKKCDNQQRPAPLDDPDNGTADSNFKVGLYGERNLKKRE